MKVRYYSVGMEKGECRIAKRDEVGKRTKLRMGNF
jgi:hypothetical protein